MNSRRTVIIAAALALAALAFFGNVYYLHNAQQRAYKNAKLVKVFVVKKAIPKGTTGDDAFNKDYVRAGQIPQEFRPGSALNDLKDIKGKVAINALSPGQVVVDGQFVDESIAQVTFAQRIKQDQVAVTVSVDQVHGVAGLLVPGDKVDLMLYLKDDRKDKEVFGMGTMFQNVNILAIGSKAAPQAGDSTSSTKSSTAQTADSGLITFEVPLESAQKIALAGSGANGSALYMALVNPESQPVVPVPSPSTSDNLLAGNDPTPYPADK